MKIKNITNTVRKCYNQYGQICLVGPNETIEMEKIRFDRNAFKIIYTDKKKKVEKKKPKLLRKSIKLEEKN